MKLYSILAMLVQAVLLLLTRLENAAAFSPILPKSSLLRSVRSTAVPTCFASGSGMDDMRRMLEASWNAESMGSVPTNVESAAEAAVTSAMNALSQQAATGGGSGGAGAILNVDILLPQFDISLGKNLYDEVLSVDFCIALANRFKGKSCIIVRDDETVRIVRRVLDAREKERRQQPTGTVALDEDDEDEVDEDEEEDDDDDDTDAALEDGLGKSSGTEGESDVDSFRRQLMAGWDGESEATKPSSKDSNRSKNMRSRPRKPLKETSPRVSSSSSPKQRYRLCSMFGNAIIPKGTEMMQAAVEAVGANALPEPDEETIIILSAVSREEMIGVRSLVAKYQGAKKFILVNCKLADPVPRELRQAQTVYSILPLIAKPAQRPENIFAGQDNRSKVSADKPDAPMKIVVLRRFPRDWEVFVDCSKGRGFELAATAPASQVPQQGPSMEWVSSSVKRFLQTKA